MIRKIGYIFTGLLLAAGIVNAQQGPPPGPPSPEMRLKHVSEQLDKDLPLKPGQKKKVLDAYKIFFADIEKLRGKNPPPPPPPMPPGKKEDVDKLVKARDESIKKALSDDQFKKYQEVEKTMRPGGRRGPGGPPDGPGGPPPAHGK